MAGRINDPKGDAHLTSRSRRLKFSTATTPSYRCRDCDQLTYVSAIEWNRAALPHCQKCGGPLLPTEQTEKEKLGPKLERRKRDTARRRTKKLAARKPTYKCWNCGVAFIAPDFLVTHLHTENRECLKAYIRDKFVSVISPYEHTDIKLYARQDEYRILRGTAHARRAYYVRDNKYKWAVMGIDTDVQCVAVAQCTTVEYAEAFAALINNPKKAK
jgi:DNA-directed RNA polymerase subunit RPC12/RpoP